MSTVFEPPILETLTALNNKTNKGMGQATEHAGDSSSHLPATTSADAGKFLKSTGAGTWGLGTVLAGAAGVCSDLVTATNKVVTLSGFARTRGTLVAITFTNGNSASAPTLNISGTGAAAIRLPDKVTAPVLAHIPAGHVAYLYFDGTQWILLNPAASNFAIPAVVCTALANNNSPIATIGTANGQFTRSAGSMVLVTFVNGNSTEAPRLDVNGTGLAPILRADKTVVAGLSDIPAGHTALLMFDGANWILLNPASGIANKYDWGYLCDGSVDLNTCFGPGDDKFGVVNGLNKRYFVSGGGLNFPPDFASSLAGGMNQRLFAVLDVATSYQLNDADFVFSQTLYGYSVVSDPTVAFPKYAQWARLGYILNGNPYFALWKRVDREAILVSPEFTGVPKVPAKSTAATNNDTLIATEAQVFQKQDKAITITSTPAAGSAFTSLVHLSIANDLGAIGSASTWTLNGMFTSNLPSGVPTNLGLNSLWQATMTVWNNGALNRPAIIDLICWNGSVMTRYMGYSVSLVAGLSQPFTWS